MFTITSRVSLKKPTQPELNATQDDQLQKIAETTLDVLGKVGYGLAVGITGYVALDTIRKVTIAIVKAKL